MKYVYVLYHVNPKNDDEKYIGVYASCKEAEEIVAKYKSYKGFKDAPDWFYIDKYELDKAYWTSGYYSTQLTQKLAVQR